MFLITDGKRINRTMLMVRFFLLFNAAASIAILFTWWNVLNGFYWLDKAWWQWILDNLRINHTLPKDYMFASQVVASLFFLFVVFIFLLGSRSKTRTISGKRNSKDLHGSSRWATYKDIKKAGLFSGKGVVIGGFKTKFSTKTLYDNTSEHALCFAATGSGKGIGLVIPTILNWLESMMIFDIKGENFAFTSGDLESRGFRVLKFEPASETGSCKFNPLAEIRAGTLKVIEDCQNIALMIIDPEGQGVAKDHWKQSGYEWLSVIILHVTYKIRLLESRTANLSDVNTFMSAIGDVYSDEQLDPSTPEGKELEESFIALLDGMSDFEHQDPLINAEVARGANKMRIKVHSERSGVHSSSSAPMALYSDPIVSNNISSSDFIITDLQHGEKPLALFLVIPPSDIERLKPLLRMFMLLTLNRLTNDLVRQPGQKPPSFFDRFKSIFFRSSETIKNVVNRRKKHKLLLVLDEFTNLGKLDSLNSGITYLRGFKIKLYIWIQNIQQLTDTYGKSNAIMANCNVRIAHTPNEDETAALLVKLVGKETIVQKKTSVSSKSGSLIGSTSESISETSRPLMTEDEFLRMPILEKDEDGEKVTGPGHMVILVSGKYPIYGEQVLYFKNKKLAERTYMQPAVMPQSTPQIPIIEEEPTREELEFTPYTEFYEEGDRNEYIGQ